jgi:hypothetical protein
MLAYVYSEEEAGRRAAAKLLTTEEGQRIASNFAKLLRSLATESAGNIGRGALQLASDRKAPARRRLA